MYPRVSLFHLPVSALQAPHSIKGQTRDAHPEFIVRRAEVAFIS